MFSKMREILIAAWHWYLDLDTKRAASKQREIQRDRIRAKIARQARDSGKALSRRDAEEERRLEKQALAAYKLSLPPRTYICQDCGTLGKPVSKTGGSFIIEVVLWLCFLVPGILYSLWRLGSRRKACRHCGGVPIPVRTPRGQELWQHYHQDQDY